MKDFFFTLPQNFFRSFWGKNFWWHISAYVVTYVSVVTEFDWFYFLHTRTDFIRTITFPALLIGGLLPIIAPLLLLGAGHFYKNKKIVITAWTMSQAALAGFLVSVFYKVFTGRIQPNTRDITLDISHQFHFGLLEHGVFWGWPSSHTTVAFAVSVALINLYPRNKKLFFFALLYAFYIGLSVATSIHWFSEFAAGALIGSAVGIAVGKSFYKNNLHTNE